MAQDLDLYIHILYFVSCFLLPILRLSLSRAQLTLPCPALPLPLLAPFLFCTSLVVCKFPFLFSLSLPYIFHDFLHVFSCASSIFMSFSVWFLCFAQQFYVALPSPLTPPCALGLCTCCCSRKMHTKFFICFCSSDSDVSVSVSVNVNVEPS